MTGSGRKASARRSSGAAGLNVNAEQPPLEVAWRSGVSMDGPFKLGLSRLKELGVARVRERDDGV